MGIDINRFVNIPVCLASHLMCGICHNILDNAIITSCGHSFCELCLKKSIEANQKTCPECRNKLRRRPKDPDEQMVVVQDYCFARNFKLNAIISELEIVCEFDFNGCQQVLPLGCLLNHLKECPNRMCGICGFIAGRPPLHNCFELMRKDRDEWKYNCSKLEEENNQLRTRIQVIQEEQAFCDFQDISDVSDVS